jgi:hypothetical protein
MYIPRIWDSTTVQKIQQSTSYLHYPHQLTHFRAKQSRKLTKDYSRIAEDMLACRQTQHLHLWIDLTKHQDTFSLVKFPNVDVDMFEPSQNVPIGALVIQVEETDKVLECMTDEQDAVGTSS